MKPSHAQHNDFLAHRPLPGVLFEHNDFVSVIDGPHAGDSGSVVSVEELGDDPTYMVELVSNKDAYISQSSLRLRVA
ncbi:MAG: hypothetical protein E6H66_24175 [Betaproteobacteria bacterium]|nr:MAG: hypothetical protein E6H66_24175 [Betaproteobacteria bacterium]